MISPARTVITEMLERFPDAATMTLAKKAYKEGPELWPSLEACRSMVRNMRGNNGDLHRNTTTDKRHHRPNGSPGDPFDRIPNGKRYMMHWTPKVIDGPAKLLLLGDVHVPYHDHEALLLALRHGREVGCDTVVLLGDYMDFFSTSRWETDPRERDFPAELKAGRAVLAAIRDGFPDASIIYKLGNHDERWESYMRLKAPELLDVDDFQLERMLRCDDHGIEIVTDMRPIRAGKLHLIHGHEYRFAISNPVNAARGLFLRGKTTAITAHFHQTSQHSEKSMDDRVVSCWSIGCLCDLRPRYMPLNKWNHGFGVVEVDSQGGFKVDNFRIIDGGVWR